MNEREATVSRVRQDAVWLIGLGAASGLGYAALLWLSGRFTEAVPGVEKPTLTMLAIFTALFVCYWLAMRVALRLPPTRWLISGIFAAGCLFRGLMLPSIPIHEIDIYRYIWDGAVLAEGVSPYRYAPQQVVEAIDNPASVHETTLKRLVELQSTSPSLAECLREIHYGHFPSPYPSVSQAVFAVSAQLTPDSASKRARLTIMKALLVAFDLATLVVVIQLVRAVGLHPGWSMAYGWCPLMMKEVANGGHLDSIAVFLATLAVWLLVKTWQVASLNGVRGAIISGTALALAIGAKLYPVVLVPLFAAVWLRRHGWSTTAVGLLATVIVSVATLYPLFGPSPAVVASVEKNPAPPQAAKPIGQLNAPAIDSTVMATEPDAGVRAFLNQWEMNDLIFMVVLENLRQQGEVAAQYRPWFVITSDKWSHSVVKRWASLTARLKHTHSDANGASETLTKAQLKAASFSLARVLTGGGFFLVACWLAWRAAKSTHPHDWCRAAMLTVAWFWLTCPTQNPWYWCWALPLLPFARYRTWYFVAALTMLYYLRFWLSAHFPNPPVLGTPYNGAYFFYFVIAWVEFVPVLFALGIECLMHRKTSTEASGEASSRNA